MNAVSNSQTDSVVTFLKAARTPNKKRSTPICIGTNQVYCFTVPQSV